MALTSRGLLKDLRAIVLNRTRAIPALLLTALLMACEPVEVDRRDQTGTEVPAASSEVRLRAPSPQGSPDGLGQSRRTAIVRAANRVAPSVVSVNVIRTEQVRRSVFDFFDPRTPRTRQSAGLGSGFFVRPDGYVMTNEHVVRGAQRIMVALPDGRDLPAELVGSDEVTDIAILRVTGRSLPVAPIGSSEDLMIGEWAVAIGNPLGYLFSNSEPTVTAGVISAIERHIVPSGADQGVYLGMIQTDASINPGNSGGPLVNSLGEVIGVNSSIFSRSGGSEGLGFAIPIRRALRVADDLIQYGEVKRPWVGVHVEPVKADAWGRTRGVLVSDVAPGSPAASAGIRGGDRLLEANGRRLVTPLDFQALLLDLRAGDSLTLGIDGRNRTVMLIASELPSVAAERVTVGDRMQLITVTPQVRAERKIRSESGALIVAIAADLAQATGFREGDVLLQMNNRAIDSAESAARLLAQAGGRVRIWFERNGGLTARDFRW
ncbi:MAG: hypothetical protein BMS9Abin29_1897 [Gemmatimonadota bacterium]|nr:MAG: hypothetical protein BMS9Abin29_1897 [Gemmatimonadota bacterium]